MFNIDNNDVVYRSIKEPFGEGILACGFMKKPSYSTSQINFTIDYYSCFVVLSGEGFYEDSAHEKISIKAGDFVQRIPGLTHSTIIVPDGEWVEFFISFGKPVYDYLCTLSLINPKSPVQKGSSALDSVLVASFSLFLNQLKYAELENLDEMLLKAQKIVLNIQKSLSYSDYSEPHELFHIQEINEACEILSTGFHEEINYSLLASKLNLSYENFRKIFKATTGLSPGRYRTNKKIEQASFMLKSGLSIKETALFSGYSDVFAFSKQFKKTMGISPGTYFIKSNSASS